MTERIVFLDRSAIPTTFRSPRFPHVWQDYPDTPAALVVDRLRDATIAITNRVQLKEDALALLPSYASSPSLRQATTSSTSMLATGSVSV